VSWPPLSLTAFSVLPPLTGRGCGLAPHLHRRRERGRGRGSGSGVLLPHVFVIQPKVAHALGAHHAHVVHLVLVRLLRVAVLILLGVLLGEPVGPILQLIPIEI
jgi:hypothetical protein